MVDHAETFLCLYSADMDAALEVQPPDSWDSFPLFQLLNDFLRMDCESHTTRPPGDLHQNPPGPAALQHLPFVDTHDAHIQKFNDSTYRTT